MVNNVVEMEIKRRELDCYSLACAVCKSADAQNYEEID
jgi:hypothetical protein